MTQYDSTAPSLIRKVSVFWLIIIRFLLFGQSSIVPRPPAFNLSHFLFPRVTVFTESDVPPQPRHFLQGVLDSISNKEKWRLEDIRVSEVDVKKAKHRPVQRYEFQVRVGKTQIVFEMYDEASEWKKLVSLSKNTSSNFEELARRIGSNVLIDSFKIEGPFELRVARDEDQLSLALPFNTSLSGLKRVSVGEGITVEVKGAEEISMLHPSDSYQLPYSAFTHPKGKQAGSLWPALCTALLPIRILGSASVVAYRTQRPDSLIQTVFPSRDAVELLPEKCYIWPNNKKPKHILSSLTPRIALLERVLRRFSNERGNQNAASGSLKARIGALNIVKFQLELERDIQSNDTYWSTFSEWRTRPSVERVWFEVVARIEGDLLTPQVIKKVRPFIDVDSFAWSTLFSNLSFTKLPSVLVPPEALTLDVKW